MYPLPKTWCVAKPSKAKVREPLGDFGEVSSVVLESESDSDGFSSVRTIVTQNRTDATAIKGSRADQTMLC